MIYLASKSPQRSELLKKANIDFEIVDTNCDEEKIVMPNPQAMAIERAVAKANGVVNKDELLEKGVILSADTVVFIGDKVFGKPTDRENAKEILASLQGTKHTVATAHCVIGKDKEVIKLSLTNITMMPMTMEDIVSYVDSGESDNRAGAYAIQETGDKFVCDIEGEFETVVGLNTKIVKQALQEIEEEI